MFWFLLKGVVVGFHMDFRRSEVPKESETEL